jgi:signal transduction histidine kinase/ligand-binding sensor domain-containing protein
MENWVLPDANRFRNWRTPRRRWWVFFLALVFGSLSACAQAAPSVQYQEELMPAEPQPQDTLLISDQQPVDAANLRFSQLSVEDGLSESVVTDILQDHLGFLWFGTQDGLNKYDGYTFTVFKHDPSNPDSLSRSYITTLYEDRSGIIWAGTDTGGINRYDRLSGLFTRFRHERGNPETIGSNRINTIFEDHSGNLWIGTGDAGLELYLPESRTFAHYRLSDSSPENPGSDNVYTILEDGKGRFWVGTARGLYLFDRASGRFTHMFTGPGGINTTGVQIIYEDSFGVVWVGTVDGLYRLYPATGDFILYRNAPSDPNSLSSNRISALWEDFGGRLWVGTVGGGLNRLNRETGRFTVFRHNSLDPRSLSNNWIQTVYQDHSGILWIGTYGGGVNKLEKRYQQFTHYQHNPLESKLLNTGLINAITSTRDGTVWVGTTEGGLNRLDPQTGEILPYAYQPGEERSLASNSVGALYTDQQDVLWIGTQAGLHSLEPGQDRFTRYASGINELGELIYSSISAIAEDQGGFLWVSTLGDGLMVFDPRSRRFVDYYFNILADPASLNTNDVWTVMIDSQNRVWAGTSLGLNLLDRATGKFIHYVHDSADSTSLSDNYVMAILEDQRGEIWIGTSSGLNRFLPESGTFQRYYQKDGLPDDYVYAIVGDEQGYLWMSSNNGIARFEPITATFKNFDSHDGLQSNEFNQGAAHKSSRGQLWFGGINGLTAFYPQDIRQNPYVPPILLTAITQRGSALAPLETTEHIEAITLQWPNNHFEFEFAALSYSRPERNQYAYMLEGFDEGWNFVGSRHNGQYTNLPGRTYTLHMIGSNNDGVWNNTGTRILVQVIPPFWATLWFRSLAVVGIVVLVLGGYRFRVRSMESRNQELERQVWERTREIEHLFERTKELAVVEERNRLARDLHDSAKQKAFAALAQLGAVRGMSRYDPQGAQMHLEEAENLVYEVIQELTFLIQEMYPIALKEKGLVTALREYLYEWESRNDIRVNFKVKGKRQLPLQTEQAVYRICQEALANVTRHSRATEVEVSLDYSSSDVVVTIKDNGCGFNLTQRPGGVGLQSMKERAEMIMGNLEIESAPERGTTIRLRVPAIPGVPGKTALQPAGD